MQGLDLSHVLASPVTEKQALSILDGVHPSWFVPFLRTYTGQEASFFLSVLAQSQVQVLKKELLIDYLPLELKPLAQLFFKRILCAQLVGNGEILPKEYIEDVPLKELLSLSCERMLQLVDCLGLRDVAVEMRMIIETARIKAIYAELSAVEKAWLQRLVQQKDPVAFKTVELHQLDPLALRGFIRQRGINRLAKALYGQSVSLMWYVQHALEKEAAASMLSLCAPTTPRDVALTLEQQVLEAVSYVQKVNV